MAVLRYIVIGTLVVFGVVIQAFGQATPFGVQLTERGLRALSYTSPSGRLVLRHMASSAHPDINVKRDVLTYAFFGPVEGDIRLSVVPSELASHCRLQRSGSFGGAPVYTVVVDPVSVSHDGRLTLADSFSLRIQWDEALAQTISAVPPVSAPFLNPMWRAKSRIAQKKGYEAAQDNVSPDVWYDRFADYRRLHTSRDGIAYIQGSEALSGATGVPLENVVLYWRGIEQPIYIDDVDASGSFTGADRVYFRGRRASGDSTWHDTHDSTSVFFMSIKGASGQRKRILPLEPATGARDTIPSVTVRQRFEVDTGYFHPGSGIDDDHSIFESSLVALEGFYWRSLYGRGKEYASFRTRFTPAPTGNVTWRADVATTTSTAKYSPEHIVSIWPAANQQSERLEIDGYQAVSYEWKQPADKVPSGEQTIIVQATGSDDLRQNTDWYSEVLVDGFDVEGDALPVLDSGRLHCTVGVSDSSVLAIKNVRSGPIYILDTARHEMRIQERHTAGVTVRSGIVPSIIPDIKWDGVSFDATVTIGSVTIRVDSLRSRLAIVSIDTATGLIVVKRDLSNEQAKELLSMKGRNDFFVIVNAGNTPDQQLVGELRDRGVPTVDTEILHVWMATAANGQGSFSNKAGVTSHFPLSYGRDGSASIALKRGVHELYIADTEGLEHARVLSAKNQGISADTSFGDVIAIAYGEYLQEASRWAKHRFSYSGKRVSLYDVEAVFEEYDAGRHTPQAIRAFLADAFAKARNKPTHCVLIGNASWDIRQAIKGGNVGAKRVDQVPTYGRPSTDMWFGLLDDEYDLSTPELLVSRFPVSSVKECRDLVDKIITNDTQRYTPSLRKFLYVGGGTEQENFCEMYRRMLDDSFGSEIVFTAPPLCIDTVTVCNTDFEKPGLQIREKLKQGVAWMNYIGHGGTDVFDIKDWDPQDLQNTERYPVMATFSCLTGNYSSPNALCENAAYLVEANKGVVASMGSTGYQYLPVVDLLHFRFHEAMRTKGLRSIGDLTYEAKRGFSTMNNQLGRNAALQYCILGDPFTRLRIDTTADVVVYQNNIRIGDKDGESAVYVQQDSLYADVVMWNTGIATSTPIDAVIRRYIGDSNEAVDSMRFVVPEQTCSQFTLRAAFPTLTAGPQRICVEIDPRQYTNDNTGNNVACRVFDVLNRSLKFIDPVEYGAVDVRKPQYRLLYPFVRTDTAREVANVSVHASYADAIALRKPVLSTFIRHDHGTYVDIVFQPTKEEEQLIMPSKTYWARAMSSGSDAVVMPFVFRQDSINAEEHVVYSDGLRSMSDSIVVDTVLNALKLAERQVGINVQSSATLTSDPVRIPSLRIAFGDTVVQSSFRNGVNIAVIRPFSTTPRVIRRYDTSPTPAPIETGHYGGALQFLTFLKDSVREQEIVVVAACNESFSDFERTNTFDQLKDLLGSYGSKRAQELTIGTAYAFVGSRAAGSSVMESVVMPQETGLAVILDSLSIRYESAVIGQVEVERPRTFKNIETDFIGTQQSVVTVTDYNGDTVVDTLQQGWKAPSNSSTFAKAVLELRLKASDDVPNPKFRSAVLEYEPAPMLYIDSSMVSVEPKDCLRGDSVDITLAIRNLHYRFASPDVSLGMRLTSAEDTLERQETLLVRSSIPEDAATTTNVRGYNNPAWSKIVIRGEVVNPGPLRSFVPMFQNAVKSYVPREDTTAPSVVVEVHGRPVTSGSFVDSLPEFTVKLLDASKLPIVRDDNFVVFVNGVRIRSGSTQDYSFLTTDDCERLFPNTSVRAGLTFSYPMEQGENLIIARIADASGNRDTAEVYLTYRDVASYRVQSAGPNPASTSVRFEVVSSGKERTQTALFRVFDQQGRLLSHAEYTLSVGIDTFTWDARTIDGSSLAPGVYYWTLSQSNFEDVPVDNTSSGMVTIVR